MVDLSLFREDDGLVTSASKGPRFMTISLPDR